MFRTLLTCIDSLFCSSKLFISNERLMNLFVHCFKGIYHCFNMGTLLKAKIKLLNFAGKKV